MGKGVCVALSLATVLPAIAVATIAAETAKETEFQKTAIPKTNLWITLLKGWQRGGVSGKGVLCSYKAGKGLYPNLNITLEDHDGKTPDEVIEKWLSLLPSPQVNERKAEKVNGLKTVVCDVSWRSLLGELRAIRLVTDYEGKSLVITFVDKSADMTELHRKRYFQCLRSLTPIKPGSEEKE